ncbi:prephenate dehydratase [bacterium A37T11]|nr:prephenate dehydratase [bacterium A37T11]
MSNKRIAIQGIKASFHEEAAFKYFGKEIDTIECDTFKGTCDALREGSADFTVMAIENSIAGSILPNYNLLRDYRFHIIGEVYLHIQMNLLALPGVSFKDLRVVESHPIALRQVTDFLEDFPHLQIIEGTDTAASAKRIKDEQLRDTAAVANTLAAETYGLHILERRIESNKKNYTRFLILNDKDVQIEKANKASLSFQTGNQVGALYKVLQCFAEQGVNLSKIQSMPLLGRRNEYDFYVDVEWKKQSDYDAAIRKALKYTVNFTIMGEYQKNDKV